MPLAMGFPPSAVQTLLLFLFIGLGFWAGRLGILDEATTKGLSKFLVAFIVPALILDSMQQPLTPALRDSAWLVLGISFGVYGLSFLLAFPYVRLLGAGGGESGALVFGAVFSNVVFMGFPVLEATLGKESLFIASIYNIPFQLLAYSVGPYILSRGEGGRPRFKVSSFVTPAGLASVVGFGLFLLDFSLPAPLLGAVRLLGSTTTPLSMALIGAILSRLPFTALAGRPRVWLLALFRLALFPAALYLLLRLLGLRGLLLSLPVLVAAMPVAANAAILSEAYGGDARTASALVLLTTLLSLLTIPVAASLL